MLIQDKMIVAFILSTYLIFYMKKKEIIFMTLSFKY